MNNAQTAHKIQAMLDGIDAGIIGYQLCDYWHPGFDDPLCERCSCECPIDQMRTLLVRQIEKLPKGYLPERRSTNYA